MKFFAILAILSVLASAENFRPVSKVLSPPKYDYDSRCLLNFILLNSLWYLEE